MIQEVKALAMKMRCWSLIPGAYIKVEGHNRLPKLSSDLHRHALPHTYNTGINKYPFKYRGNLGCPAVLFDVSHWIERVFVPSQLSVGPVLRAEDARG